MKVARYEVPGYLQSVPSGQKLRPVHIFEATPNNSFEDEHEHEHEHDGVQRSVPILIMSTPPNVWLRLRAAFWRIFPCLLTAEWRQIEEGPKIAQGFIAASRCKVGAKDSVAVP